MADIADAFWQMPAVSRTLATAIFATSVGVYCGIVPAEWLYFQHSVLFQIPPQIWRIATSFLVTQPKLSILLDPYFLYSYLSQLETSNPRFTKREDLVWYLVFVSAVILTLDAVFDFSSAFFLPALILALAYTGTRDQAGMKMNFIFITVPAQLVPYTMMLMSLLMNGPGGLFLQLCGLAAAHLYEFLTRVWPDFGGGRNYLATPAFVSRLVSSPSGPQGQSRGFGTAFRNAGGAGAGGAARGAGGPARPSGGLLPDSWRTRGRGQRLGGDP